MGFPQGENALTAYLYDSVPDTIPANATLIAFYADGRYANEAKLRQLHPNAEFVGITTGVLPNTKICDCETGDATPAQAAQWAFDERQANRYPTIYCSISNFQTVQNALAAHGLHFSTDPNDAKGVFWWAAGYTNAPYLANGSVATQFEDHGDYDISETNGVWPNMTATPAPSGGLNNIVGGGATPDGQGYWLVGSDGGIFTHGNAPFNGSEGGVKLNAAVVGVGVHPSQYGYWIVAADGGIFCFGACKFFGSPGNLHLNAPVKGMMISPTGNGYALVAEDGGVFAYGDFPFKGAGV